MPRLGGLSRCADPAHRDPSGVVKEIAAPSCRRLALAAPSGAAPAVRLGQHEDDMTNRPTLDFIYSSAPTQHWGRRREILAQHPEVRSLMAPNPYSALWIAAL